MNVSNIQVKINEYYSVKIDEHGLSHLGVDWNSKESQELRFYQLAKLLPRNDSFSVIDYGCGFGSFYSWLLKNKYFFHKYLGYDISPIMLNHAKGLYMNDDFPNWANSLTNHDADYVLASGIFNVKLDHTIEAWTSYVLEVLEDMNSRSIKGFSFNILSTYSDIEYRKSYLFYADPLFFFDYCKKNFSKNVSLLHDYNLYEFSILIKK